MKKRLVDVTPNGPQVPSEGHNHLDVALNQYLASKGISRDGFNKLVFSHYRKLYPNNEPKQKETYDRLMRKILQGKITWNSLVSIVDLFNEEIVKLTLFTQAHDHKKFAANANDIRVFMAGVRADFIKTVIAIRKTYEPTCTINIGTLRGVNRFDATSSFSINIHPADSRTNRAPYQLLVKPVLSEPGYVYVESSATVADDGRELHLKVHIDAVKEMSSAFVRTLLGYITLVS